MAALADVAVRCVASMPAADAAAVAAAYEVTQQDGSPDAELLKIAKRWGGVVEREIARAVTGKPDAPSAEVSARIEAGDAETMAKTISRYL